MEYTVEQFFEDVRTEAQALRENATSEEVDLLNRSEFDPEDFNQCIYGQMTGSCQSKRASELIHLCCPRYFKNETYVEYESIEDAMVDVNGEKIEGVDSPDKLKAHREDWLVHLSSLETYIMTPEANIGGLISYLKGEIDTLEL